MSGTTNRLLPPPPVQAHLAFEPFDSDGLELLHVFLHDARTVSESSFATHLPQLGERPQVFVDGRYLGGGGYGRIRTTSVSEAVRAEVFPTLRKLRTESNWASAAATRNLMHRQAAALRNDGAAALVPWLREVKRRIREANRQSALVAFRVSHKEDAMRTYETTGEVLDLVQNGRVFHNERDLRRDLEALPQPILDPVVDDGLRQIAEIALALAVLAHAIVAEPRLVLR